MAIQLQIRRGTTAQNESFIGAAGEISLDTDTMTLRIHDGQHAGGFVIPTIVAEQKPTADNNYTWYKKYSNGWVEQGGVTIKRSINCIQTILLPIVMCDANYTVISTTMWDSVPPSDVANAILNKTQETFGIYDWQHSYSHWYVSGMAA